MQYVIILISVMLIVLNKQRYDNAECKVMKSALRHPWAWVHSYVLLFHNICLQVAIDIETREEHNHGDHVSDHQVVHPTRHLAVAPIYYFHLFLSYLTRSITFT